LIGERPGVRARQRAVARSRWLAVAAACLLVACDPSGAASDPEAEEPEGWITIRGQRIALELAITAHEQRLGLGRRDELPWGQGMLFLYAEPRFHRFWMKDMRFDIDIVWIRAGRIVDISHGVRHVPGGTGDQVAPRELADRVLEVPAGYAAAQGWRPGQPVEVELIRAWPADPGRAAPDR